MSEPCWMGSLKTELKEAKQRDPALRIAVLGIGSELRGDDAAGPIAARGLHHKCRKKSVLVMDGGVAPENCTGIVRRFKPGWLIAIDAAEMAMSPGAIQRLPWEDVSGVSASTHSLPIHMLIKFLIDDIGCQVALIGIQPKNMTFNTPMSPEVRKAVDNLVETLADELLCEDDKRQADT